MNLARQIADTDPDTAKEMLDQIGHDLQDAVQELRNLAHGIYPPLLMDRGLPDALSAAGGPRRAAHRASTPRTSVATPQRSRRPSTSAASKRCRTRASTPAKAPRRRSSSHEDEGALLFEVADDGAGFDLSSGAQRGHGFVNMSDRVGAIGGSIVVDSAPGAGTKITGRIPLGAS